MTKTFRRATFELPSGERLTLEPYYSHRFGELLFRHLTIERVYQGKAIQRIDIHPWEYKFNTFRMMRGARRLLFGQKTNHVKS